MDYPRAGAHYPRSTGEFLAWFGTDEDCLDYLEWLRWPGGFACPYCGNAGGWRLADGRVECGDCSRRTSVTAGTIFDKTRTPLTVWFHACWLFATAKDGISARYLQRALEIGSYQTAWAMLHRLRSALVRPGRDRLAGAVEVDGPGELRRREPPARRHRRRRFCRPDLRPSPQERASRRDAYRPPELSPLHTAPLPGRLSASGPG